MSHVEKKKQKSVLISVIADANTDIFCNFGKL